MCTLLLGELFDKKNSNCKKKHNPGIIKKRINKDTIVTTKGTYRLSGPPKPRKRLTNSMKTFYKLWAILGGFPKKFQEFVKSK